MSEAGNKRSNFLFLYTELAGYVVACLNLLAEQVDQVSVVRWPVNKEAPFKFHFSDKIKLYDKGDYPADKLDDLIEEISPKVIYTSGWIDKDYNRISKKWKKNIPIVVGMDNKWKGSIKQQLASVFSPFKVRDKYTHAWVAGPQQKVFAKKLGFSEDEILTGVYSADVNLFDAYKRKMVPIKHKKLPHRFIYLGRYVEWKGIFEMWEGFKLLNSDERGDWELWCIGTGECYDKKVEAEGIQHFGFIQPEDLYEFMESTSVYILPSKKEPWGVSVHEFAAAGFPLICSKEVGAAATFVEGGRNGYLLENVSPKSIKAGMQKMIDKTDDELRAMGDESVKIAQEITPQKWVDQITGLLR